MIELDVQINGVAETVARFDRMTDAVRARLRELFPRLGEEVRDAAAARAPHHKGKLRESIRPRLRESGDKLSEVIKPSRFYGRFQETGLNTMRKPRRSRGIIGARTRLTKAGTVLVSPRRGLMGRQAGVSHPFHLPAHPFMRPALDGLRASIADRIRAAVAAGQA